MGLAPLGAKAAWIVVDRLLHVRAIVPAISVFEKELSENLQAQRRVRAFEDAWNRCRKGASRHPPGPAILGANSP